MANDEIPFWIILSNFKLLLILKTFTLESTLPYSNSFFEISGMYTFAYITTQNAEDTPNF